MITKQEGERIRDRINSVTIAQAWEIVVSGEFGPVDSDPHRYASSCLVAREAKAQETRDTISLEQATQIQNRLIELKKPHWSLTPALIVAVLTMLLAAIAAWPVIRVWILPSPPVHINSNFQSPQPYSGTKTRGSP